MNMPFTYMKFRAVETAGSPGGNPAMSLIPGNACSGYLAGQLAITGIIQSRQAVYDDKNHGVEIIVAGMTKQLDASTVNANPGQYLNQTIGQIAAKVAGEVGVNAYVDGGASGADVPFERVQEHLGETRHQFIQRLACWRNLHIMSDQNGDYILFRGSKGGIAASLVEGRNILKARMMMSYEYAVSRIIVQTQLHGNDAHWADMASAINVQVANSAYSGPDRPLTIAGEQTGNKAEAQMRADHEMNLNVLDICEANITTPGWLMDDGGLWMYQLRAPVSISSPMLMPDSTFSLLIKGVKHMQDNQEGTRTEITCCIPAGLGAGLVGSTNFPGV